MTAKKTSKKTESVDTFKPLLIETVNLSQALVREVDNLMTSKLPPAQIGKVLGDIMSGFSDQIEKVENQIS